MRLTALAFVTALCALPRGGLFGEPIADGVFGTPVRVAEVNRRATAVTTDGNVLYCGAGGSLFIFDITNPLSPRLLTRLDGFDLLRQIAVDDGWVAISSRARGAWIVDARDPARARLVSHFESVEQATGIEIAGNAMFVGQRGCGVEFVDITDRSRPEHIRMVSTPESQSCMYEDGYVYSGDWHSGEVTIIDARDFSKAAIIGKTEMHGLGDGFDIDGRYIYASTGHHRLRGPDGNARSSENWGMGHGVEIWDRSDLNHPRFVSRVQFPKFWRIGNDWWVSRKGGGDTVFCSDTYNGLFAVNVADKAKPFVSGRATFPSERDREAPSRVVSYVAVADGAVYAAVQDDGVYALPCKAARTRHRSRGTRPKDVSYRETYATPSTSRFTAWQPPQRGAVHCVARYGDYWYVGCGAAGCHVIDANWRTVGRLPCAYARDVAVQGDRLLVAEGDMGLGVYSLSRPASPKLVSRVTRFQRKIGRCEWVIAPSARWALCSGRGNAPSGWSFVDFANPSEPRSAYWANGLPWLKPFASHAVGGRWLCYAQTHSFLKWFDLSGRLPVMIDTEDKTATGPIGNRPNFIRGSDGCTAFGNDKILLVKNGEFIVLDPAQDRNADGTAWTGAKPVGCPRGVRPDGVPEWNGDSLVAFVSTPHHCIQVYDVSDVSRPRHLWHEKVAGFPENACFSGRTLCIPCGYQGLLHAELPR